MRPFCAAVVSLSLLALLGDRPAPAQSPPAAKIRLLLTSGGHAFPREPFYAMFDAFDGIQYTKAEFPQDLDLLRPGLQKDYDVLVMYDMNKKITPEQQEAFAALLREGIGLVSLHHNLGANPDWPEFRRIVGGQFLVRPGEIDGREYPKSTWEHDQELRVMIADPEHPITKGLAEFTIHDETYGGCWVSSDVHLLLKTDNPKNIPQLCWTSKYGRSPVVYLMLGHDDKAYANPSYRTVLSRAIRWVAGQAKGTRD